MRLPTRAAAAALLAVSLALAGCDSKPKLVPVSGRVLVDGQPLTTGVVQVVPAGYRAASGKIGPDGRFTLTTSAEGDGCVIGTHQAAVVAHETLGPGAQKWHAPKKYIDPTTSGLSVTVDGPTTDLTINLSWDGGKPFVERFGGKE
jgi:hypothetical protein